MLDPRTAIRRKIYLTKQLPLGTLDIGSIILVILRQYPSMLIQISRRQVEDIQGLSSKLHALGLHAVQSERRPRLLGIAYDFSTSIRLRECLNMEEGTESDRLMGELSGFPKTAIDAYCDRKDELLSDEDQMQMGLIRNRVFYGSFCLSQNNTRREINLQLRWNKIVRHYAPEFIEECILAQKWNPLISLEMFRADFEREFSKDEIAYIQSSGRRRLRMMRNTKLKLLLGVRQERGLLELKSKQ